MPRYRVTFKDGDYHDFTAKDADSAARMARRYSRENLRDRRFSHDKSEVSPNIRSIRREGSNAEIQT